MDNNTEPCKNHMSDTNLSEMDVESLLANMHEELAKARAEQNKDGKEKAELDSTESFISRFENLEKLLISKIDQIDIIEVGLNLEKKISMLEKLLSGKQRQLDFFKDNLNFNKELSAKAFEEKKAHMEESARLKEELKILKDQMSSLSAKCKYLTSSLEMWKKENIQLQEKIDNLEKHNQGRLESHISNARNKWGKMLAVPVGATLFLRDAFHHENPVSEESVQNYPSGVEAFLKPVENPQFPQPANRKLKIAAIMDDFTRSCYAPDCELLNLDADKWRYQLASFKPDLLFIESAWLGKDGGWRLKVSNFQDDLQQLIADCRINGIPVMFWNKEDPSHYDTFLPVAGAADFVFTTDIDAIPRYKKEIKHDRVYLLPFAAQPAIHNPIEKYDRKNCFCFAGSYYLRYIERQRDMDMLTKAITSISSIEIYDRNFGNPHPHYQFPAEYKPYILGKLPYEEIDKAYKGYNFGVNMNTIKQSQSMFARRTYELAACNTVVVSNFSRGLRNFFGDLVISSDNDVELASRLLPFIKDENMRKRLCLRALRHVLNLHTYSCRLDYIKKKIWNLEPEPLPKICVFARVSDSAEAENIINQFEAQSWPGKSLWLCGENIAAPESAEIHSAGTLDDCREQMNASGFDYYAEFRPENLYAPAYLEDLANARLYSPHKVYGKGSRYEWDNGDLRLHDDGMRYKVVTSVPPWAAICKAEAKEDFWQAIKTGGSLSDVFSVDEFNFIENGFSAPKENIAQALDLPVTDKGVDYLRRMLPLSESLTTGSSKAYMDNLKVFTPDDMLRMFKPRDLVNFKKKNDEFIVTSRLENNKHTYCEGGVYNLAVLNLDKCNVVNYQCDGNTDVRITFVYLDDKGKRLAHTITKQGSNALPIPPGCAKIKLSLRVEGPGTAFLSSVKIGMEAKPPSAVVCKSDYLVLAKQYPSYDDLYKYGFLQTRVEAYKKAGHLVDFYRLARMNMSFSEYMDIDIATGDEKVLDDTLASGQIKHVLVHLIDHLMWSVLKKHLDKIRVTIWVHGAEIQGMSRRTFEFENMDAKEIGEKIKRVKKYANLWQDILKNPHPNLQFVFVSNTLLNESQNDIARTFPEKQTHVIHNFINGEFFANNPKQPEQRFNIVSIRPYSALTYANDLSVKTILELSKRKNFEKYRFTLIGDGPLFKKTTGPVANFPNVHLAQTFMTHAEMRDEYAKNGIVLIPTRSDTQGVSRDEAMACGLVPITNAVSAVPEFVNQDCACMVESEDYIALADAIEDIGNNPDKFLKMSQNAAEHVRKISGYDETIKRELQLFVNFVS